jgi:hypothetical protein
MAFLAVYWRSKASRRWTHHHEETTKHFFKNIWFSLVLIRERPQVSPMFVLFFVFRFLLLSLLGILGFLDFRPQLARPWILVR